MVLDLIFDNLVTYIFGSRILLGLAILGSLLVAAVMAKIDKSALLLLLAPIVLAMGRYGYLPSLLSVVVFIAIFILWGIMFKMILGKRT